MSENRSLHSATDNSDDRLFEVLKRPSLHEMRTLYQKFYQTDDWTIADRVKFFKSHSWTLKEFCKQHRDLGILLPHD